MKFGSTLLLLASSTTALASYTGPILKSVSVYKNSTGLSVTQTCELYQHSKIQTVEVGDAKTVQNSDSHITTLLSPTIAKASQGLMNQTQIGGMTEVSYFAYKANDDGTIERVDLGSNANGIKTTNNAPEAEQLKQLLHFSCQI